MRAAHEAGLFSALQPIILGGLYLSNHGDDGDKNVTNFDKENAVIFRFCTFRSRSRAICDVKRTAFTCSHKGDNKFSNYSNLIPGYFSREHFTGVIMSWNI